MWYLWKQLGNGRWVNSGHTFYGRTPPVTSAHDRRWLLWFENGPK